MLSESNFKTSIEDNGCGDGYVFNLKFWGENLNLL